MKRKLRKLVFSALFAALTCAATIIIQIPAYMNGYLNLGDCFVLLSGFVLGPLYGFCAAGIGSCLADIITGYGIYAPASFLIKGLVALIAIYFYNLLMNSYGKHYSKLVWTIMWLLYNTDYTLIWAMLTQSSRLVKNSLFV